MTPSQTASVLYPNSLLSNPNETKHSPPKVSQRKSSWTQKHQAGNNVLSLDFPSFSLRLKRDRLFNKEKEEERIHFFREKNQGCLKSLWTLLQGILIKIPSTEQTGDARSGFNILMSDCSWRFQMMHWNQKVKKPAASSLDHMWWREKHGFPFPWINNDAVTRHNLR